VKGEEEHKLQRGEFLQKEVVSKVGVPYPETEGNGVYPAIGMKRRA